MEELLNRFEKFVGQPLENGCIPWMGCRKPFGHGNFNINGKKFIAHRVSYLLYKGPIPEELEVRHTCDNGWCVNPDHLLLGTHKENMQDRNERNRTKWGIVKGEENPLHKLSEQQVDEIRESSDSGIYLAKKYKVSQSTISRIKTNKRWTK